MLHEDHMGGKVICAAAMCSDDRRAQHHSFGCHSSRKAACTASVVDQPPTAKDEACQLSRYAMAKIPTVTLSNGACESHRRFCSENRVAGPVQGLHKALCIGVNLPAGQRSTTDISHTTH
jgi:hypothetical protein